MVDALSSLRSVQKHVGYNDKRTGMILELYWVLVDRRNLGLDENEIYSKR